MGWNDLEDFVDIEVASEDFLLDAIHHGTVFHCRHFRFLIVLPLSPRFASYDFEAALKRCNLKNDENEMTQEIKRKTAERHHFSLLAIETRKYLNLTTC